MNKNNSFIISNSALAVLYFFQFSFWVFISPLTSFNSMIIFSTIFIVLMLAINNARRKIVITFSYVLWLICPIVLILLKTILYPQDFDKGVEIIIDYMTICVVSLIVGAVPFDITDFLSKAKKYSFVIFGVLVFLPIWGTSRFGGYMRFGYAILPVCDIFLVQILRKEKKQKWITIMLYLIAVFEMIVFGARGALFCHLLFCLFYFVFVAKEKEYFIIKVVLLVIGVLLVVNLEPVLLMIKNILNSYGYRVYAIDKYLLQFDEGFIFSLSGREKLWEMGIEQIKENPIFGGTLSFESINDRSSQKYYHNIFVQLAAEFGIPLTVLVVGLIVRMFVRICKHSETDSKIVFLMLFSIAFGRLFFSSTYWSRPELWLLLGMYYSNKFIQTKIRT